MKSVLQHVQDRHVNTRLHSVWVDELYRVASFPLWNVSGLLISHKLHLFDIFL